jgi:hypothetical protein
MILAAAAAAAFGQASEPYEVMTVRDVMVPMRDGVRLALNLHRPARGGVAVPGKFPVILSRTPYDKNTEDPFVAYAVARGYVVVVQDVRGRYASEGRWVPIADDPKDGYDTAVWIGRQPWCDGSIGTIGSSYVGATQHALAIANPPHLKAMVPRNAMSNFGRYGLRHNGAFELRFFNWVLTMGAPTGGGSEKAARRAATDPAAVPAIMEMSGKVNEWVRALPLRAGTTPLKFTPDYEKWLIEAMGHGEYDDFWKNSGSSVLDHLDTYKDVPVYHVTGWYDSWGTPVANMNYPALTRTKKSLQRLIVGPWIHSSERLDYAGEAQFTRDAALDLSGFQVRWFDRWLKGIENGVDKEPPVKIYVMGGGDGHKTPEGRIFVGGRWREEREWPLTRTVYTDFYLRAGGGLSKTAPGNEAPVSFAFDPRNPVPSLGGNVSSQGTMGFQGAADQRCRAGFWLCKDTLPLSARNDVLVFQTEPLAEDLEVTGRLVVKLWASTDGPDTDFTAKLIDVYPPNRDFPGGVDLLVGDSIVRGRFRNGGAKAEMLEPGKPYEFTIEMYPTSLVFQKGHRIRVDVSSSNFPRFDVNPNTGEPLNGNRRWRTATNTVYLDAGRPSRIVLPVIPGR